MQKQFLSADEVVARLGISKGTLYSYVSRGLIRSEETDDKTRAKRYVVADVEALQQRKAQRRNPAQSAAAALHFGDPVLESAITLIRDGRLYYRGEDALQLAEQKQFEEVAIWLWTGTTIERPDLPAATLKLPASINAILQQLVTEGHIANALQMALLTVAPLDLAAYNHAPTAVQQTGMRILSLLTTVLIGREPEYQKGSNFTIAHQLQQTWAPAQPEVVRLLDRVLILCADHELNASSFTARCVASTGATPYAAIVAALAALQGYRHGGSTREVARFLQEAATDPVMATQDRLRRGEQLPGFDHPLYPQGDPRGKYLLDVAREYHVSGAAHNTNPIAVADQIVTINREVMQMEPNLDFGLTVLAQSLGFPAYAPFALFALGRCAGWIGHISEQYQAERLIRPRAHYTGITPALAIAK